MSRIASALLIIAALAAPAAAKPADPFETFVSSIASDPKALATHYKGCQLLLAPNGEARTPCTLSAADLIGTQAGVTFKVTRLAYKDLSRSTVEYIDADVEARAGGKLVGQWHVVEIGGGVPDAGFMPRAAHWARMISDKDATARAKAHTLPAAPAIAKRTVELPKGTDEQVVSDRDQAIDQLEQSLHADDLKSEIAGIADDGVVWGSAPGQRWAGRSGSRAIAKWKMSLAHDGEVTAAGDDMVVCGVADITDTKSQITYAALIVMSMQMDPGSGDHLWNARLASFAIPQ